MRYIRTKLATDWDEPKSWLDRFLDRVANANPGYSGKYHLIDSWAIEFDDDNSPWREIALDATGAVVFAGPSQSDYGFWLDTDYKLGDFPGEPISQAEFEAWWIASGVVCPR